MINNQLLTILKRSFGNADELSHGDYAFHCPICHHHKPKLIINVDDVSTQFGSWHCWVCTSGGGGITSLYQKSNKELLSAEREYIKSLFKDKKKPTTTTTTTNKPLISLPAEFKSLLKPDPNNPEYRNAIYYAKTTRGLTEYDIIRYNIGYCDSGKYNGRLIIPSYDADNNLNYFQARVYYDDADCNKFDNPTVEYSEIIGFENFINWNEPLVFCEALLDGIAIRHNAIPCFGKKISDAVMKKIYTNNVTDIYIFQDPDAMREIIQAAELFYNMGKNVYIIDYKSDLDASKLGYIKCQEHIRNAIKLTETILLTYKIKYNVHTKHR